MFWLRKEKCVHASSAARFPQPFEQARQLKECADQVRIYYSMQQRYIHIP